MTTNRSNKTLLFQNTGNGNGSNPVTTIIDEKLAAFQAFEKKAKETSLAQIMAELGIKETTSKGGWPSLQIGPDDGITSLAQATIPALNALRDLWKYDVLEVGHHRTRHNPLAPRPDVEMRMEHGKWVWYSYINGRYERSKLINSDLTPNSNDPEWLKNAKVRASEKRSAMIAKHDAIDQLLLAKHYGAKFLVVLNRQEELEHYQRWLKGLQEKTFAEVQDLVGEFWGVTAFQKSFQRGVGDNYHPSQPQASGNAELIEQIKAGQVPVLVKISAYYSNQPVEIEVDPANSKALDRLAKLSPVEKIVSVEPVA